MGDKKFFVKRGGIRIRGRGGDLLKRGGIKHFFSKNRRIIFAKIKMHNKIAQFSKISKKKVHFSYANRYLTFFRHCTNGLDERKIAGGWQIF